MGQGDDAVCEEEQELDELVDENNGDNADDVVGEYEPRVKTRKRSAENDNPFKDKFGAHGFILYRTAKLSIGQRNDHCK